MAALSPISHEALLRHLQSVAERAIGRFGLPDEVSVNLINLSENATYCIEDARLGRKWALRVHREGYHSRKAIESELCWLSSLRDYGVATLTPVPGVDGELIQVVSVDGLAQPRHVVLFHWEDGVEPTLNDVAAFESLGETAARMHAHVRNWQSPSWFERHTWDFDTTLGDHPHWGRWRSGIGMTPEALAAFSETAGVIEARLEAFGRSPDRFNLVHGDMRLANLLVDGATVKVIDFDDSGFSWLLYDCATTVSFFEHAPEVPELLKVWMRGYRRAGILSTEEENEIETFVMLRRLLLVAWLGSHSETDLARSLGAGYTQQTIPLCERYLSRFGGRAVLGGMSRASRVR